MWTSVSPWDRALRRFVDVQDSLTSPPTVTLYAIPPDDSEDAKGGADESDTAGAAVPPPPATLVTQIFTQAGSDPRTQRLGQGLTLVPTSAQLKLTLPLAAQLSSLCPSYNPNYPVDVSRRCSS